MQVAVTVWEGRISPLFDSSRMLLIAEVVENRIMGTHYEPFDCDSPVSRAAKLHDLGVCTLICGGISDDYAKFIEAQKIEIMSFASGVIDEVLEDYLMDRL